MSLVFSDQINKNGIVQLIDRNVKSNNISYPIEDKTSDINLSLDRFIELALNSSGKWQFDDSNHTDYPIISTSLIAGQRDYTFVEDQQGNLILDIYKVTIKDKNGIYQEICPVDVQSDYSTQSFYDGINREGTPFRYDKTANGIFLDSVPDYDSINGLKVYINREGSYFQSTDTTKKPGIPGLFHNYLAFYPSYLYALRNELSSFTKFEKIVEKMEVKIKKHFAKRERDRQEILSGQIIDSR